MSIRKTLSDRGVTALKPRHARYAMPDPELRGCYVRVQPSGAKSFVCVARTPSGKQVWTTIGDCEVMPIEEARSRAREILQRVRDGLPAIPQRGETFGDVAANWLKRHAQAKGLRTEKQITRLLRVHVFPVWKNQPFLAIRRSDVARFLDDVEDNHGARQADMVLTVVRSIMNWFATRNDDYTPPIVRGMRRQNPMEHTRDRTLTDPEIRAIWKAAESGGTLGAIIRLALLTGQRRTKIASLQWADLSADGIWTVPVTAREKGTAGSIKLPPLALDIIRNRPRLGDNRFVFPGRGAEHFCGFGATKRDFDAKLSGVAPWRLHDLRRTARSLLSRAQVQSEIAELILGHAVGGVQQIYDRYSYDREKAIALQRLATLVDGIVNPRHNVTPMRKRAKRR
jgi:integrase